MSDELFHYGVKGMKWRIHRRRARYDTKTKQNGKYRNIQAVSDDVGRYNSPANIYTNVNQHWLASIRNRYGDRYVNSLVSEQNETYYKGNRFVNRYYQDTNNGLPRLKSGRTSNDVLTLSGRVRSKVQRYAKDADIFRALNTSGRRSRIKSRRGIKEGSRQ